MFNAINRFFHKIKNNQSIKNGSIVGICTITSKACALVREFILNAWLGNSAASDALIAATRIPALLRKSASEGAINGVLIPIIGDLDNKNKKSEITSLINALILIFSTIFTILFLIQLSFPKAILRIIAPGILNSPEKLHWFLKYSPYTNFCSTLFFLYGLFSAILNYNNQFFFPAIAQAVWNIILFALFFLAKKYGYSYTIIGPAWIIATFAQMFITLIPYYKLNIKFDIKVTKDFMNNIKEFFKKLFPIFLSSSISQINIIIIVFLTSYFPSGTTTLIYKAERALQLPTTLIIPFSTIVLPMLSRAPKNAANIRLITTFSCIAIALPITILCYFFNFQIVSLLFFYGKCTLQDVQIISKIFQIYSIAMPAFFLIRVIPMFFFANKEVKIPTIAAAANTVTNITLNLSFIKLYGLYGFAISAVISAYLHIFILFYYLIKQNYFVYEKR